MINPILCSRINSNGAKEATGIIAHLLRVNCNSGSFWNICPHQSSHVVYSVYRMYALIKQKNKNELEQYGE